MSDRLAGSVDLSATIRIIDSVDGTPELGVVATTPGLVLQYRRELGASVTISALSNLAALTTAHTDGGLAHIGNGYYRVDAPDAAWAVGSIGVLIHGTATGMVVVGAYYDLVGYNPQDAANLGLTTLTTLLARIVGTLAAGTHQPSGGDTFARIGAAGISLTNVPWNPAWDVEVQSEVQDAIEVNNLDHLVGTDVGIPALPVGTYLAQMATVDELADELIGPVVTVVDGAGGNTALTFKIDMGGLPTNGPKNAWLSFSRTTVTVALQTQVQRVTSFNTVTDFITVAEAYTTIPQIGDTARLVTR